MQQKLPITSNKCMFKSTAKTLEKGKKTCLKVTLKTLERRHRRRSRVFIVNIKHI